MNILDQISEAVSQFTKQHGRKPEDISITKQALLDVARLEKRAYYPNKVLGIPVMIWSPSAGEFKANGNVPFRLE